GIEGNLNRIIPAGLQAVVDLPSLRIPTVMRVIRQAAEAADKDMLRTFNMGVGIAAVAGAEAAGSIQEHLTRQGCESYLMGEIVQSSEETEAKGKIRFTGSLPW